MKGLTDQPMAHTHPGADHLKRTRTTIFLSRATAFTGAQKKQVSKLPGQMSKSDTLPFRRDVLFLPESNRLPLGPLARSERRKRRSPLAVLQKAISVSEQQL